MAGPPDAAVASDFADVLELMQKRQIVPRAPSDDLVRVAKTIHGCTYSLILWRFRLGRLPAHGRAFLDELSSDALQILPQVLMGYNKTTCLLIRGILENALRHIYFSDHPVEFGRLNRDKKWYLNVDFLVDYAKNHHDFVVTENAFDALCQITSLYSELSECVHGRTLRNLEQRTALARITFDQSAADKHAAAIVRCAQAVNFMLAIFHRKALRNFTTADRRLILRSMPVKARQVWTHHQ